MSLLDRFRRGRAPREVRQELYCHDCTNYVQFTIDESIDGNHVLECPVCGHEHCRVVKDGVITDIRWDQRNGPAIPVTGYITYSSASTFTTYTNQMSTSSTSSGTNPGRVFLYQSWMNRQSGT